MPDEIVLKGGVEVRKIFFLLVFCTMAFFGCIQHQQKKFMWYKPDSTDEDFYRDRGQCVSEARAGNRTTLLFDPIIFSGCMAGRGWHQQEEIN